MNLLDTATLLSLVISVIIPGLSSLLSRAHWPVEITALITLLLATGNGFVTEWAADLNHYDWRKGALTALGSYVIAAFARQQFWKGTDADAALLAMGSKVDFEVPSTPDPLGVDGNDQNTLGASAPKHAGGVVVDVAAPVDDTPIFPA